MIRSFAMDTCAAPVSVALGAILTTLLWMRHRKRHRDTRCSSNLVAESVPQESCVQADGTLPSCPVVGLHLLAELQLLSSAPFDIRCLGRLAACSSQLRTAADVSQLWQYSLDKLNIAVRMHLDLGIHSDPLNLEHPAVRPFPPGCRVRLDGLSQTEFNGLLGTLLWQEAPGKERLPVQLDPPQCKRLLCKPVNLKLLECCEVPVHPKVLLSQTMGAVRANAAFYAAFRAGDWHQMRALWLNEAELKPDVLRQLLGASQRPLSRTPAEIETNQHTDLPQRRGSYLLATRCRHPGQGLLLGHERVCSSWDQILGGRRMDIHPAECKWEVDGRGRARVTLSEIPGPGFCIRAMNSYALVDGTWRMLAHVAD
eukprot:TRINITY_DN96926_c0_g1_i1.p1 TRINITY_DN96926_c0_g1~~TRINITY_DN96926_c0_g1_i1.p1  ORF type:complete len:369 (-),score=38.91 TRINITY_DN96926_c0_g1_i1:7-1113(-)